MTRHTCLHTRVQYRLCPADQPLTEACFSKTPLQFNTGKQQLQWNNGTRLHGVISSVSTYIYSYLLSADVCAVGAVSSLQPVLSSCASFPSGNLPLQCIEIIQVGCVDIT